MTKVEIVLLTSFNTNVPLDRLHEYNKCLERNARCTHIDKIVLFLEDKDGKTGNTREPIYQHPKIKPILVDHRTTLNELFAYAGKNFKNVYVIVANADIYFDNESNLDRVVEMRKGAMWALTRYEWNKEKKKWSIKVGYGSYDSFIFKPPLKKFDLAVDLEIGTRNIDSYLAAQAMNSGIQVANPAKTVVSKHFHDSLTRDHDHWSADRSKKIMRNIPDYRETVEGKIAAVSAIEEDCYMPAAFKMSTLFYLVRERGYINRLLQFIKKTLID